MKLNGKIMVTVAMMLGALGAAGCNQANEGAAQENAAAQPVALVTPVSDPAPAPAAKNESTTIAARTSVATSTTTPRFEQDSLRFRFHAPFGPPAVRYENPGRSPSARHFWVNGHYRYENGGYRWIGGRWDVRREGHTFVQPHYRRVDSRYHYVPGHWVRL